MAKPVGGDLKYWHGGGAIHGKKRGTKPGDAYWSGGGQYELFDALPGMGHWYQGLPALVAAKNLTPPTAVKYWFGGLPILAHAAGTTPPTAPPAGGFNALNISP